MTKLTDRPGYRKPEGYDDSMYKKPSVACDMAVFTFKDKALHLLLIQRGHDPYGGYWALPGGFVEIDEPLENAAARELMEETGLSGVELTPFGFFGDPDRDPRARVMSAAYMALVDFGKVKPKAGDDAKEAEWFDMADLPELAFDHDLVIRTAMVRLKELTALQAYALNVLPQKFTLYEAESLLSRVMGRQYIQRWLFRRLRALACVERSGLRGKYRFRADKVKEGVLSFLLT